MMNRIRELRKAKGLTIEKLAEQLDTSNSMISMLEKGDRRLNSDWLQKLALVLGCAPSDIISDKGYSQSDADALYELLDRATEEAKKRNDEFTSETLKMLMERQKK